jgi:formate/nitrite transporter FocA (FNT family)
LWVIVLLTNLLGTLIFASAVGHTEVFSAEVRRVFAESGIQHFEKGFWTTLYQGIFAVPGG